MKKDKQEPYIPCNIIDYLIVMLWRTKAGKFIIPIVSAILVSMFIRYLVIHNLLF